MLSDLIFLNEMHFRSHSSLLYLCFFCEHMLVPYFLTQDFVLLIPLIEFYVHPSLGCQSPDIYCAENERATGTHNSCHFAAFLGEGLGITVFVSSWGSAHKSHIIVLPRTPFLMLHRNRQKLSNQSKSVRKQSCNRLPLAAKRDQTFAPLSQI